MKGLPESEIYEQELTFWPYKESIQSVITYICEQAPQNASVIDLMCGPGYLLGKIAQKRPDLKITGMDIDERYISFAKQKYSDIPFVSADILTWIPSTKYDVVVCTGSLHHIPYEKQEEAVARMSEMMKSNGFLLISDCYVNDYSNEKERKKAAAKLGYEYLIATIENDAPDPVLAPTVEVLDNDVFKREFKTSLKKRLPIFNKYFHSVETWKTWPKLDAEYGDYITVMKSPKDSRLEYQH